MAILLVGCANQQPVQQAPKEPVVVYKQQIVYDETCGSLAKYARAVAVMRDLSVNIDDVDYILPLAPNVTTGSVQRYVYNRADTDPITTSNNIYKECVDTGYYSIIEKFKVDEDAYKIAEKNKIEAELAAKKKPVIKKKYTVKKKPITNQKIKK